MTTMTWTQKDDFPLSRISHYSSASTSDAVWIIGGLYAQSNVAIYENHQWRRLFLRQNRRGHKSITIGNQIFVVGGREEPATGAK